MVITVRRESLPWNDIPHEFVGDEHDASITFLLVDAARRKGAALHMHPYDEVIVILEGEATLDDGMETRGGGAGDSVVIPAGQPHGFTNTGKSPLKQVDIHASPRFLTEWLD
jgi:mannose-6-phosphate isomerase-like protein (cupin superfamily)